MQSDDLRQEQLLVERARNGDAEAFRELVERSKHDVFRLACSLTGSRPDAEDLSQDVFVKAYRSMHKFRGDAKWSTWLYRITVNTCMDHGRAASARGNEKRFDEQEMTSPDANTQHALPPDRIAESGIINSHIEAALMMLSSRERAIFVLRHYHDYPLKQIAETLELAEGTVKSHLFRAIRHLQHELSFYRQDLGLDETV